MLIISLDFPEATRVMNLLDQAVQSANENEVDEAEYDVAIMSKIVAAMNLDREVRDEGKS